ncbi:cytochrome c [Paraburkholderia sp.]|jgi:mono/diheme cytochrome c family protein|uniref:c-type cytochrome n=1 Tax=Paraburkholderia sp. TaxID=1926495 RepID=UPI002F411213
MPLRQVVATSSITVVATLIIASLGAFLFSSSGRYDVSASSKDSPLVAWMLHRTYEASLHHYGGKDIPPADLMSLRNIEAGARFYNASCAACHGAPGKPLSVIGQGIEPSAPALLAASRRNSPKLMFWTIKHGVNMTAMPSFGKTQSDETLWQTAAFLYDARGITPEKYAALVNSGQP